MNLKKIRYKGDIEDTKELFDVYKVQQIIKSHEEILKEHITFRDKLLADSVRLTPTISPRIYKIIEAVKTDFGLKQKIEFFSLRDNTYNAFAFKQKNLISVVFTSALLENFDDAEIKFVLGHELGHIIYDHNKLLLLYNPDKQSTTFLPILAEKKFLTWQKKAEISCDRVGLAACKKYEVAVQSLLKITYGLTEKNLNFNLPELMKQLDDLAKSEYMAELSTSSHPLLPVRLKAIELFSNSKLFKKSGKLTDEELHTKTDELLSLTKFYPRTKVKEMMMKLVAAGGISMIAADKEINLEEIKSLVKILADVFTDDPESEIIYDKEKALKQLEISEKYLKQHGTDMDRYYTLHFLTLISLSDGKFTKTEKEVLMNIAESIGLSREDAMDVVWKTLQQNGITIDVRLNEIAQNVQEHYADYLKE